MSDSFVHLHLHTQYSLLDGAIQAKALAKRIHELGMPAAAITDHGNLFGALEFYLAFQDAGVKPILGCEVYLAPGSRFDHTQRSQRDAIVTHLVLLAKSAKGYRNLCRIVTAGHFEGFYYKPRVDREILQEYSEDLIALSGCIRGDIASNLKRGRREMAVQKAKEFAQIFSNRFYIEIQRNGCKDMQAIGPDLVQLAREVGLPMVATNDCHYLNQDDADAHEVLLCLQSGKTLEDEARMRPESTDLYVKTAPEMRELFKDLPEACDATLTIADSCDVQFDLKSYHYPKFELPQGLTLESAMEKNAQLGFSARLPSILKNVADENKEEVQKKYQNRLDHEIRMIQSMGFSGYFLIVADFVNYAKGNHIPVGPGRGSAAGSLVAYSMGITDIDPLPYGLLFERFLNPERVSMPDIDMDFCIRGRDQVIAYVQERYGKNSKGAAAEASLPHVAQIITFGKMQARAVIRDVGRVMNMPYADVDRISKMVPPVLNITLEDALKQARDLYTLVSQEAQVARLMELAMKLEGLVRHASIHAAGVVITDEPLVNYMPLYRGADGEVVTQYDMKCVEKLGLIKFDFLGLRTLTLIEDTVRMIRGRENPDFDLREIPLNDKAVFDLLSSGDTLGIFQLESSGMRDLITRLRPSNFEELIALVALYRPGPLGSGMVDDFIKRKHGKENIKYPFPQVESILKETYGIIVYQEQVMQIASVLANYTLGEADLLRRAMGKKKPEEMAQQKDRFLDGALTNKIARKDAEPMFELMEKFAEYGFNKSHSAAYALISYQTAYLKAHYRHSFMASLLNSEQENTDKIFTYLHDCRSHKIPILPPDVNESDPHFTVASQKIRFGLAAVKTVGQGAVEAILESRNQDGSFADLRDFCCRVDLKRVNRRVLESLIMCGAFDFCSTSRSKMVENLEGFLESGQRLREARMSGQTSLFSTAPSLQKKIENPEQVREEEAWPPLHRLSLEKKALGFFITGHPLHSFEDILKRFTNATTLSLSQLKQSQEIRLAGVVTTVKKKVNRKGQHFAFVQFEDLQGVVEVVIFAKLFETQGHLLSSEEPLFLVGNADIGEESAKVVAKEILQMHEVPGRFASKVEIRLLPGQAGENQLLQLKETLTQFKGRCPIYIRLSQDQPKDWEMLLSLPQEFQLNPTPKAIEAVNQVFGSPVAHLL